MAEPVTIIIDMTLTVDELNDELLEAKLNAPHIAFDIPSNFIVENIRVTEVDSPEVMGSGDELNDELLEAKLNEDHPKLLFFPITNYSR